MNHEILDEVADVTPECWLQLEAELVPLLRERFRTVWIDKNPPGVLEVPPMSTEQQERVKRSWAERYLGVRPMHDTTKSDPPRTKDCGSCEAPIDVNGPTHAGAGDCRAAQRKLIRSLKSENESLRGRLSETERMRNTLKAVQLPSGSAPRYVFTDVPNSGLYRDATGERAWYWGTSPAFDVNAKLIVDTIIE